MSAPDDIKNILGPNEKVELFIQEKIYHPRINIESVIITNERIIFRHPHALNLKKDYTDYSYRDIINVKLDKGILRSTIKLMLKPKEGNQGKNLEEPLDLDNLPNDLAEKGYGIIRENIGKFQTPFSTGYANVSQLQQQGTPTSEGQKPTE
jgi:Bacterial PH domain